MTNNIESIPDLIGLLGVVVILVAYFLCQIEKWSHNSLPYLVANLVGAVLIAYSLMFTWNLASFVMEVLWGLISIIGIIRTLMKK